MDRLSRIARKRPLPFTVSAIKRPRSFYESEEPVHAAIKVALFSWVKHSMNVVIVVRTNNIKALNDDVAELCDVLTRNDTAQADKNNLMITLAEATRLFLGLRITPDITHIELLGECEPQDVHMIFFSDTYGLTANPPKPVLDPRLKPENLEADCFVLTKQRIRGVPNKEDGSVRWELPEGASVIIPPVYGGLAEGYLTCYPVVAVGDEADMFLQLVAEKEIHDQFEYVGEDGNIG